MAVSVVVAALGVSALGGGGGFGGGGRGGGIGRLARRIRRWRRGVQLRRRLFRRCDDGWYRRELRSGGRWLLGVGHSQWRALGGGGGGGAGLGGAVFNHGGVATIVNSTFSGNQAKGGPGANGGSGFGASLFNLNGSVTALNVTFAFGAVSEAPAPRPVVRMRGRSTTSRCRRAAGRASRSRIP